MRNTSSPWDESPSEPKATATQLAIKGVLDKWSSCSISIVDAESELKTILCGADVKALKANIGNLKIECEGPFGGVFQVDGIDLPDFGRLTVVIESGAMPMFCLEAPISVKRK